MRARAKAVDVDGLLPSVELQGRAHTASCQLCCEPSLHFPLLSLCGYKVIPAYGFSLGLTRVFPGYIKGIPRVYFNTELGEYSRVHRYIRVYPGFSTYRRYSPGVPVYECTGKQWVYVYCRCTAPRPLCLHARTLQCAHPPSDSRACLHAHTRSVLDATAQVQVAHVWRGRAQIRRGPPAAEQGAGPGSSGVQGEAATAGESGWRDLREGGK